MTVSCLTRRLFGADGAANRGAAGAERIGRGGELAELALPGTPGSLGMEWMEDAAPTEDVGCTINAGQEAKTEILAESLVHEELEV